MTGIHNLTLALRVIAPADVDVEPRTAGIAVELLVEAELTERLGQHHKLGLVVDTLLRDAAEVLHGLIVQPDEALRVDRL